jgi:uncharacterized protein (TIGR00369 family)
VNETDSLAGAALMREFIPASPFAALLGISIEELGLDRAVLALPDRPDLATVGDVVHGGALATLMDTAAMAAAWCTPEPPPSLRGATASLTVTYLAPATGRVLAEAAVLRRGSRLVTLDVAARCGERDVARALATYALG